MIDVRADVWVDVTTPDTVYDNAEYALNADMDVVIGTSGLTETQTNALKHLAQSKNVMFWLFQTFQFLPY
ncbi:dihydrodipicolinate reductase [Weissella viridescens]|uniref:Dihydrodipicolinate reductase n=1 Tax=Weissella viridescens TaxID=1629 RepID=A0A380P1F9_WEIVI|nr:dihydrodipicolinate reductase [Weissella viridescens]